MQRQSLGSPGSKLHIHGGSKAGEANPVVDDPSRRDSSSSSMTPITDATHGDADADEFKFDKPLRGSYPPRPEKLVHLIPVLTIICFLILYLCSHEPSDIVLAQFGGFKQTLKPIEFGADSSSEIDDLGGYLGKGSGRIVGIKSLRKLREMAGEEENSVSRKKPTYRKLGGDF